MSTLTARRTRPEIDYPECDGEPMADNTVQFSWIVRLQGGLDLLFRDDPSVFVAGDLFWYPVEGNNKLCVAPDVMVAFGRPKGDRGSYRQWEEGNVAPQVVFEILSQRNRPAEHIRKFGFYDRFGVEEFYMFDPETQLLDGWLRKGGSLIEIEQLDGWTSPRLGVRFDFSGGELQVLRPDGRPLATYVEMGAWAEQEYQRAEQERQRADQERQRADQERQRNERLLAQLKSLGIEPAS